jgi:Zn-dependent protease
MVAYEIDGPVMSRPVFSRHGVFFWMFSTLVTIRFTFVLVTVLSAGLGRRSVAQVLVWLGVVTVAILLHEFGHVAAARYFGHRPKVELYTLGGLTTWMSDRRAAWQERLTISLAGPGVGFVLAGIVWCALRWLGSHPIPPLGMLAVRDFMWVCIGWGIFNLLPILPLDGGQALEAALGAARVRAPRRTTRFISIGVGVVAAVLALAAGLLWAAAIAGLFAYNNAQQVRGLQEIRVAG